MKKSHAIILAVVFLIAGLLIGARTALDNAILVSDMDAAGHKILNLPSDQPLPPVVIPNGAVTDANVAAAAGIQQSKLNLNGSIPTSWLGTTSTTAAEGSLAEYVANKGVASGYAALDSTGKVPTAQLPILAGTGTVTSVSVVTANGISGTVANPTSTPAITLSLGSITPNAIAINGTGGNGWMEFALQSPNPAVSSIYLRIWANTAGLLSFGHSTGTNGHAVSVGASTLSTDRTYDLPDKNGTIAMTSDITTSPSYQPVAPSPTITASGNTTGARNITFTSPLANVNIFYEIDSNAGPFIYYGGGTVSLASGGTHIIYAYSAEAGWSNSSFSTYTNPNP